jgi:hypothetical protein
MGAGEGALSNTAILSAYDDVSGGSVCVAATVREVDNNATSPWIFPAWVRVDPGTHSFRIQCTSDLAIAGNYITARRSEFEFSVTDMKPRHVYVARYLRTPAGVKLVVQNLGENSRYMLPFRYGHVRPQF